MVALRPFVVAVEDDVVARIRARVAAYPWFPAPSDEPGPDDPAGWARGVNTVWLRDLCAYWVERFDWRAAEAALNRWPQTIATVDGFDLHVVHVTGEARGRRPLLLTHGWPGSHVEFWDVVEPLAFPSRFGGDPADAFDLVIPSLPGYGFSARPDKPMGQRATARLFDALMTKGLGYGRYLAQGGDWGGLVTSWLGLDHSASVRAIHLNMIGFRPTPAVPQTQAEKAWLADVAARMQAGGAYFAQQATKPQTLAMALMDSPVGAAAWILEKFHGWADLSAGGIDAVFARDRLLTNVMIYLVTGSMATSVWYYRALFEENGGVGLPPGARVETPTAFANFPGESLYAPPPRTWAERAYNIVSWRDMPRGGHFAAMEQPALFVEEVRAFGRLCDAQGW